MNITGIGMYYELESFKWTFIPTSFLFQLWCEGLPLASGKHRTRNLWLMVVRVALSLSSWGALCLFSASLILPQYKHKPTHTHTQSYIPFLALEIHIVHSSRESIRLIISLKRVIGISRYMQGKMQLDLHSSFLVNYIFYRNFYFK